MIEVAVVVGVLCLVVIAFAAVVLAWRMSAAAQEITRLAATIEAEVRPVARDLCRTADHLSDLLAVARSRVKRTDEALDLVTKRVVRLSDRLFDPLEGVAALLHAVLAGFRCFFQPRRKEGS